MLLDYNFNGKPEKIQSPFSRLSTIADKAGNFTIISVGDQRNKCRSYPRDLTKIIYELPSTRVSAGKDTLENIREGKRNEFNLGKEKSGRVGAEFMYVSKTLLIGDTGQAVVDLIGTPPFDFEWRRYELVWDSKHKRHSKGKVLESHMVHGIESHRYYISTSQAGTIEVTYYFWLRSIIIQTSKTCFCSMYRLFLSKIDIANTLVHNRFSAENVFFTFYGRATAFCRTIWWLLMLLLLHGYSSLSVF